VAKSPKSLDTRIGFGFMLLGAVIYLPTLGYELLTWDDTLYVSQNPWIREISGANIWAILTQPYSANYLPLHLLSYMFDYAIWELNPLGYHLSSLLLNAVGGGLAYWLLLRLGARRPVALAATLLFVLHPCHVPAVAWVSNRKSVLSLVFMLAAMILHLRGGRRDYALAMLCFVLAVASKLEFMLLPALLMLVPIADKHAFRPSAKALKDEGIRVLPYLVMAAIMAYINTQVQAVSPAAYTKSIVDYLAVKGDAVLHYIPLLMGAMPLRPIYDLPAIRPLAAVAVLLLPALVILSWYRKWRTVFLGGSWIGLSLLAALAFPLVIHMADRYLYAPSLGFCWLLAAGVAEFARAKHKQALTGLAIVVGLVFALRTFQYMPAWKTSTSLMTYAAQYSQDFRIYQHLGRFAIAEENWEEAERLLKVANTRENFYSQHDLGELYFRTNRYAESRIAYEGALALVEARRTDPSRMLWLLEIKSSLQVMYRNLARMAVTENDWLQAEKDLAAGCEVRDFHCARILGDRLAQTGRSAEAAARYRLALEIDAGYGPESPFANFATEIANKLQAVEQQ
jgi:tetratricopeptide (TPR) repeat protein